MPFPIHPFEPSLNQACIRQPIHSTPLNQISSSVIYSSHSKVTAHSVPRAPPSNIRIPVTFKQHPFVCIPIWLSTSIRQRSRPLSSVIQTGWYTATIFTPPSVTFSFIHFCYPSSIHFIKVAPLIKHPLPFLPCKRAVQCWSSPILISPSPSPNSSITSITSQPLPFCHVKEPSNVGFHPSISPSLPPQTVP